MHTTLVTDMVLVVTSAIGISQHGANEYIMSLHNTRNETDHEETSCAMFKVNSKTECVTV